MNECKSCANWQPKTAQEPESYDALKNETAEWIDGLQGEDAALAARLNAQETAIELIETVLHLGLDAGATARDMLKTIAELQESRLDALAERVEALEALQLTVPIAATASKSEEWKRDHRVLPAEMCEVTEGLV